MQPDLRQNNVVTKPWKRIYTHYLHSKSCSCCSTKTSSFTLNNLPSLLKKIHEDQDFMEHIEKHILIILAFLSNISDKLVVLTQ